MKLKRGAENMSKQFESIMRGLQQVAEYKNGDKTKCRVRNVEIPNIEPVQEFSKDDIKSIRLKINLPQTHFAELLGVSSRSVEAWEAGTRKPTGTAKRLFQMINNNPNIVDSMVRR
jgi:putative transcriptional regulator